MAGSHHEWWSLPQHRWNPLHTLPFYSLELKQITIMMFQVRKYISKQQTIYRFTDQTCILGCVS